MAPKSILPSLMHFEGTISAPPYNLISSCRSASILVTWSSYLTRLFQFSPLNSIRILSEKGEKQRPVIIHRAILGSVERFMAVLTENYGGKWPFWLSPRQAIVVPIHSAMNDYANSIRQQVRVWLRLSCS